MKRTLILSACCLLFFSAAYYSISPQAEVKPQATEIEWLTIEEALAAHETAPKKIFIDLYTDWCRWCKVMDEETFGQADVAAYINENFHPVKFNAEQKEAIEFKGQNFEYLAAGRRGIHALAYALLDRQAGYPAFVVLDEDLNRMGIIKGFKQPKQFMGIMQQYTPAR